MKAEKLLPRYTVADYQHWKGDWELWDGFAIANVLSDTDAEIEKLETRLKKTRMLKQGMMQELLTGRTRLT